MNQEDGFQISQALLLIGGIVAIAFGATTLGSLGGIGPANLDRLLSLSGPLMTMIVGAAALVASSKVKDEPVDVVVAVLGFISGGTGGVLVAVAGVLAIISKHTLKSPTSS